MKGLAAALLLCGIDLTNEIGFAPVIASTAAAETKTVMKSRQFSNDALRKDPGPWNLPAAGQPEKNR
jgi:hypothetical protein